MSEATTRERGRRKTLIGIVVSNKMDKTAVVVRRAPPAPPAVPQDRAHRRKRYKAHDPNNEAVLGDVVRIEETRPLSKEKRWRIAETMTRGNVADIAPRDIGAPEERDATPAAAGRRQPAPAPSRRERRCAGGREPQQPPSRRAGGRGAEAAVADGRRSGCEAGR